MHSRSQSFESKRKGLGEREREREREALSHSDRDRYGQTGTIAYGRMGYAWATNVNGAGGEGRRAERLRARGLANA